MSWRSTAERIAVECAMMPGPPDAILKAFDAAYPFGERKYHPYKVWLAVRGELRAFLHRYDGPMNRPCRACGVKMGEPCIILRVDMAMFDDYQPLHHQARLELPHDYLFGVLIPANADRIASSEAPPRRG